MSRRDKQNLNPTPEAVFAMRRWPEWYAIQRGGVMDFYLDVLIDFDRSYCVDSVKAIRDAWEKSQDKA